MRTLRHAHRGFAMLEAMVSILVVSIGFLGFAGLQSKGLATSSSSLMRSKAIDLTYQMTDRVRANLPGAQAGSYNLLVGSASNPGCVTTGCTPAQMAQSDYFEWRADVAAALPSGTGAVCIDSTPDDGVPGDPQCDNLGSALSVKIWWTEKNTQYRFVNPFRP